MAKLAKKKQRKVYRRLRKSSRAPDVFFGVKAKLCEHGEAAEIERDAIRDGASTPVGNQRYMDIPYELSAALFT